MTESEILLDWGFEKTTNVNVLSHANACSIYSDLKIGQIIVHLGFMKQDEVEVLIEKKPANMKTLEWFAMQDMRIKSNTNRIIAIQRKILFIHDLNNFDTLTSGMDDQIVRELQRYEAILLIHPEKENNWIIAFASHSNMSQFRQLARFDRANNPIYKALENQGAELSLAIGFSGSILERLHELVDSYIASDSVISDDDTQQFWSGASAVSQSQKMLAGLLDMALSDGATDIDLDPQMDGTTNVLYRRFGDLMRPTAYNLLGSGVSDEIVNFLLARARANPSGSRLWEPKDGQIIYRSKGAGDVFLRCSFVPVDHGSDDAKISVSIRLLPRTAISISLDKLNMSDVSRSAILKTVRAGRGMTVVAGPTNSGKSTTIAGIIHEHIDVFSNRKKRISMEDPVERYLNGVKQIHVQTSRGDDAFEKTLVGLMRHDPDFIWVGEIRERRTALASVRAANTGHQVVTTLHANDSVIAIRELSNMIDAERRFSLYESLNLVIGQRLVKHVCPHCSTKEEIPEELIDTIKYYADLHGYDDGIIPTHHPVANNKGCDHCHRGYVGLLPIVEVLPVNRELKSLLSEQEKFDYKAIASHRLCTLFEAGMALVLEGKTEIGEILV